ncbi:PLP-dependent aminotransferase family protein [Blastopirellula sp. J2-11]|uniref:MocR-like pyridoxine biosynthesis transcription factor PdxR n=1 Tax=Blastopirellula sp. J2-11 TaxID=2943192 RepID=UPI0021C7F325|nr:PLP-dependent aminotransferase family protein [Blastopirellula sp. J2-11]UUO07738.1 PLP-dependent aminotransferase family protein [Blastopirellula sp. J2-11]
MFVPSQLSLSLDNDSHHPLHVQIYFGIRDAILSGRIAPQTKLPSTRALAEMWSVSRSTVVLAFENLTAEGYLQSQMGSGTFTCELQPDRFLRVDGKLPTKKDLPPKDRRPIELSKRGQQMLGQYQMRRQLVDQPHPFRPGVSALETFPIAIWRRLTSRRWRSMSSSSLVQNEPFGFRPLREEIARHLRVSRDVHCEADQVVVVSSTQHALALIAQVLIDPGDPVWIEDPGYLRAQFSLSAAGATLIPVPIDAEGFNLEAARRANPNARLAYVTPSHQYPLGAVMSLSRRLEMLEWANRENGCIIEDDYISEYRYAGRPSTALQGLDELGRVLYLGTFSKVFSPALRLGYLVLPPSLLEAFQAERSLVDRGPSYFDQAVLSDFLKEGYFDQHIRKMRTLYSDRRQTLQNAIKANLEGFMEIGANDAGMHVLGWLPPGISDVSVTTLLAEHGIMAPPLSHYCLRPHERGALLLGFTGYAEERLVRTVELMSDILRQEYPSRFGQAGE